MPRRAGVCNGLLDGTLSEGFLGRTRRDVQQRADELFCERGIDPGIRERDKPQHAARMLASRRFRHVTEVGFHATESGDAERFIASTLSQSHIYQHLERGVREDELGLTRLRSIARRVLGEEGLPWYWTYHVRIGVK